SKRAELLPRSMLVQCIRADGVARHPRKFPRGFRDRKFQWPLPMAPAALAQQRDFCTPDNAPTRTAPATSSTPILDGKRHRGLQDFLNRYLWIRVRLVPGFANQKE